MQRKHVRGIHRSKTAPPRGSESADPMSRIVPPQRQQFIALQGARRQRTHRILLHLSHVLPHRRILRPSSASNHAVLPVRGLRQDGGCVRGDVSRNRACVREGKEGVVERRDRVRYFIPYSELFGGWG